MIYDKNQLKGRYHDSVYFIRRSYHAPTPTAPLPPPEDSNLLNSQRKFTEKGFETKTNESFFKSYSPVIFFGSTLLN